MARTIQHVENFNGLWDERSPKGWRRCFKHFYCRHKQTLWFDWPEKISYETKTGKYTGEEATVATCPQCRKRILCQLVGQMFPSKDASMLIDDEIAKIGAAPRYNEGRRNYGSGWYCELPAAVSSILDNRGEDAARVFVRRQFGKEGCQEAFNQLYGSGVMDS